MKKNLFFIITLIFIIVIGLFLVYYLLIKNNKPSFPFLTPSPNAFPEVSTSSLSLTSPSPSPFSKKFSLKAIVSQPLFAFWSVGPHFLQIINSEGLLEIDYADENKITKKNLGVNLTNILDAYSFQNKVVLKYLSEGATQPAYALYDIENQVLKNFEPEVKAVTWSPQGDSLIYYYSNSSLYYKENLSENNYLAKVDNNLNNKKIIFEPLKLSNDLIISWPATSTLYISEKPSGYVKQTILSFDLKNKIFKPFFEGYGLILKWRENGDYGLLFSTQEGGSNPTLQLINSEGLVLAKFPKITLPEKCVFARQTPYLYCAFPQEFNSLAVWPDDYYQEKFSQEEIIYQIDLRNYEARPIFSEKFFEISQIELSLDEKELLFYDKLTNTLYALSLGE